jgi:membrane associated rhomboid family serine protease
MNPYEVRYNYQLWRPITSLFLTSGLYNYGYASAYLLIFGFMMQVTKIKFLTMLSFYLICGFVGNIFGALCNPNGSISVGSDPANFGIFSGLIATFIVNWKALDNAPQVRCPLIFVLVMITLMLLLGSLNKTALLASYHPYEVYAAWGGWICGFFLGLIMMPHLRRNAHHVGSYEKFIQKVGAAWLVIYLAIVFSCFFTVYSPPKWY